MSRQELADAVNAYLARKDDSEATLDANHIGKLERGDHRWPNDLRREAFRHVLKAATDSGIGFYIIRGLRSDSAPGAAGEQSSSLPPSGPSLSVTHETNSAGLRQPEDIDQPVLLHSALAKAPIELVGSAPLDEGADALVESVPAILSRVREQSAVAVSDALLDALELYVNEVVDRYEEEGPAALAPEVVRHRQWLQPHLVGWLPPRYSGRLAKVAAQMSAQLSYMAVNLGRFGSARAYSAEAFQLADHIRDDDLKAWIRGTQSLTEYYDGRYDRALELAVDGQRYAKAGHQAVRLMINGEARALAKLGGEPLAVERVVGQAYELLTAFPLEPGMTPCISFGLYSEARVASNAATAYLAMSQTPKVLEHAHRASAVVDASPSVWSQALVRLDTATALVQARPPDLEQATALVHDAMVVTKENRVESIKQRTRAFVAELHPWSDHPSVRAFVVEARAWLSEEPPANDRAH